MPTLPAPVKQQLNQMIQGTLDDIQEVPQKAASTALQQFGMSQGENSNELPTANTLDSLNPAPPPDQVQILEEQDRQKTLVRRRELIKQLDAEIAKKRQERQVLEDRRHQEEVRLAEAQAQQPASPLSEPAPKQKRGLFGGMGGKKKAAQGAFSNIQKSQAEMAGKRTGG